MRVDSPSRSDCTHLDFGNELESFDVDLDLVAGCQGDSWLIRLLYLDTLDPFRVPL